MDRAEALRALGLEPGASAADIKAAYREMAQILHPDRFAANSKLQDRATEQFKNLQEAYEALTSGDTSSTRPRAGSPAASSTPSEREKAARLAGLAAARVQLVKQKDLALDERRNGLAMALIGRLVALAVRVRFPALLAIASTACIWGVIKALSAHKTVATINEHLSELRREQKNLERDLGED